MKNKEKLYFGSIDENFCYSLEHHINGAKIEGLAEITLIEAIPANNDLDHIWCKHEGETVERSDCRKSVCPWYSSKSGRGVCEHRGNYYLHGEEISFNVDLT